ncbi:Protein fam86a, partial [Coemansia sp. BCRC 34301]
PAFKDRLQVAELDWEHNDECAKLSDAADVIIGADITYDPTIVPMLVDALKAMVSSSQQVAYITAAIRNQETFDLFLKLVGKFPRYDMWYESGVLGKSVMDLSETKMATLCHPNPTADVRLVLITRK